jgi:hypothetical protein
MSRKALKYALKYGAVSSAHAPLAAAPFASTSQVAWSRGGYVSHSPRALHLAPSPSHAAPQSQPQRIQAKAAAALGRHSMHADPFAGPVACLPCPHAN